MKQHSKSGHKFKKIIPKLTLNPTYYNLNKFFSYTDLFMAMIDGGRGIGKTTSAFIKAIINSNKGEEFIYLRRYKPEIKDFVNQDSLSPIVEGIRYRGDGTGGYMCYHEDHKIGNLIALSTSRSYKSVDFSKVTLIIFDEAFVKQGTSYRYLKGEVIMLLEFVSTVVRTRTNVKVILFGNNEDMFSPYHSYFNIPTFENIYIDKEHGIYCEHAKNSLELLELEKKTGLHKLIKDTSYGDYHYDNKLINAERVIIGNKPNNAVLLFRICMNKQTINAYTYYDNDMHMYIEYRDKPINDNITYTMLEDGKINYFNIDLYRKRLKSFVNTFYYNNRIIYSDSKGGALLGWVIENT